MYGIKKNFMLSLSKHAQRRGGPAIAKAPTPLR